MEKLLCFDLSSKELQNKCGIYIISCNDHTYIGSSKSLYSRLLEHRNDLLNNKHSNDFLQNVANKYNTETFKYKILEYCNNNEKLIREKYYIDLLKPDLNLQKDPIIHTMHNYSINKLKKSIKKGRNEGKYIRKKPLKPVLKYDLYGNFICEYESVKVISKLYNISEKKIAECCREYCNNEICCINNILYRFQYKYSTGKIKKLSTNSNKLLTYYDVYIDNKKIKPGIRTLYNEIQQQIISNNLKFTIEIKGKT